MTLYMSTKSVVLVVLVSSVVVCSSKSYFPYIQSSSQYPIGSRDVYNGFNLDRRWNLNDEYFDGSDNYWTGFRNGLQRRHRVRRQQPLDQKAEFEAKIAILRRLGIIKPTSTIQQPPPQSEATPAQTNPAASPKATPAEPSPKTQEPQSPAPQPQPVGAQPVVPRPQAGAPQFLPPPDTPALLPEPAKASPTPEAKPATDSPNPSPPPPSKPQPTINPYLPVYPNRSYLNNPKEVNGEGPQPGPVPNQGIPERSTTPAPKVENTTPINKVVNQPQPKPPQYPKQQVLTPINRQQQVVNQPQYPKQQQVLTKSQPPPQYPNQQYRPLVTDPRYQQQPQYPDPRYNSPSSYNPQQINPQGFYPRQPLNKQPVTARAPPPVYRPPTGAAPTYRPQAGAQPTYRPQAGAQPPTYGQPAGAQSQPYRPQAGATPTSAYRPPTGAQPPTYGQPEGAQPPTYRQQPGAAQPPTYRPQTGAYPNQYYPTQGLPNTQGQSSQTQTTNKAQDQEGQRKSLPNPSNQPPQPPAQAPVIVDPYTGQEYYQVPGILPPFTDKLNQLSLELLNQSLPTPTPPLHPPYSHPMNGYPQPLGGITPEVDDDAEAEAIEDRMELLRMLQAQGNHIDPNSPQLSTLLHQMMEEGELEFDDDGFLPPTINPTATVTDPTVFGYQQMGEYPTNSQVPYWFDGSSYNRDGHGSDAQANPDGRHQGNHQGYQGKNQENHQGYHQGNHQGNPQGHLQGSPQDLPKGEQPMSHQEWHMHPSVPGILTRTQVTNTPPLYRGNTGRENSATAPPPTISPAPNNRDAQEQIRQQQLKSKQRIEYLMMLKKKLERFAQLRKQLQQRQRAAQSTPATVDKMILRQSAAAANNPQGAIIGQQASQQPSYQVPQSNPQSVPSSNGNPGRPNPGANGNQGNQVSNQALQGNPNPGSIGNQGKPNQGTNTPPESSPGSNGQKVQAALVNQQATKPPEMGSAGNFSAVAMVANPGMSKSEVTGVIIGTLLGIVVVLVPLLCLLMRYRKHLKLKRKRFFPRPYSKRSDTTRGSHDAMDTMVYSELGKQTLAFDSDGNGNTGNHESDYLVSLPGTSINDNEAVYNNNMDGQGQGHLMSLTSSKRADSVEISRLLTLRETERKPKVPDATKRPALPTRGKVKATLQQHGSLQMLH